MILPIILAGGSGSRLWPLSRQLNPKQFIALSGDDSLFKQTVARVSAAQFEAPWVICNEAHRFLTAEQLRELGVKASILLEPIGRNTATAICLAALRALQMNISAKLLVLPSDHLISDCAEFHKAVEAACHKDLSDKLVTFGVRPTAPETGYGYIRCGQKLGKNAFQVDSFVEKPDRVTAQQYLDQGDYFWNSGMFCFTAETLVREMEIHAPEVVHACKMILTATKEDSDFIRIDEHSLLQSPDISIDFALMEKTDKVALVPLDSPWSDLGSWSSLMDVSEKDASGNVCQGDTVIEGVKNSYVRAEHRLVSVVGLEDVIVVETKDAVLVSSKDQVQDVKKLVDQIKGDGRHEHISHREVYRPWGRYDSIDNGYRYQVKRITVNPGARLSLQMHYHRAEHWIVVSGTAKVVCGGKTYLVTENQSTYIPVGDTHSLENPGKVPLELIEVQSGVYLGEDDIVRFEDKYGRVETPAREVDVCELEG